MPENKQNKVFQKIPMKLSTRIRHSLRIMIEVASDTSGRPVLARNIAEMQEISEPYVDQILLPLRTHKLLVSVRGRSGGYRLARTAKEITLLDVVQAMEGNVQLADCLADPKECKRSATCVTRYVWAMLTENLKRDMKSVNLADLVVKQAKLCAPTTDYTI